ncbi:MAG: SpoIIE family protein phosphatase [Gemmatimonadota bacterium]|nr:SpoIIE family protein phosphatase [Gemmatimonadota bacterium]
MNELGGRFAARQIPGKREYQEDDYGLLDGRDLGIDGSEHTMLLVADGMGGHVGGATASGLLSKTFVEAYSQASGPIVDRLRDCLEAGNKAIADAIAENPELDSMGSTLVAAVVSSEGLNWISVGDSPLWLFRDDKLERLNADHSMAPVLADLVATGRMTEEDAARDPRRHSLRSAVMGDDIHLIDVSSQPVAVQKGDRLLLASDGLMTLSDQEIAAILKKMQDAPLEDSASALIQAVEDAEQPHQDNTTVLLYAPAEGAELATAAIGEEEVAQDKPRLKRKRWGRLLGMLLCVAVLWGVLYWLRQGENAAVGSLSETVETPATTNVEPIESDVQVPMASDAEESAPVSQAEAAGDSTRAGGEKAELNEPQEGKEETKDE